MQPTISDRLALRERPKQRQAVMYQSWRELLFLHWTVDARTIQQTLPPGLFVDTFDGHAYLGIVPFFMRSVRPRFAPTVPRLSNFLEMNLRTYVHDRRGIPGVWFYSLDASQWLAVKIARACFKLPYFYADMQAEKDASRQVSYMSRRRTSNSSLWSRFCYRGEGSIHYSEPGSFEFFLVERYLLNTRSRGTRQLRTGRVHHAPYPLLRTEVPRWDDHLFLLNGFEAPGRPPDHMIMSPGVDVEIFALERLRDDSAPVG